MEDVKYVTLSGVFIVRRISRGLLTVFYASIDWSREQTQLCDNYICRALMTPLTAFITYRLKRNVSVEPRVSCIYIIFNRIKLSSLMSNLAWLEFASINLLLFN